MRRSRSVKTRLGWWLPRAVTCQHRELHRYEAHAGDHQRHHQTLTIRPHRPNTVVWALLV
nr:MAG TPA: hypothetical protein [Crassvirales sp.]